MFLLAMSDHDKRIFTLIAVGLALYGIGWLIWHYFMMTRFPQQYAAMQQRAHERQMIAERERLEKERQAYDQKAAKRQRNNFVLGIGMTVVRALIGGS
jgi:hypothetical protein